MESISKNFGFREFVDSPLADAKGIDNRIPDDKIKKAVTALVLNVLQPLRDALGEPMRINSGYRCPELNRLAGGVPASQHAKGEAADIAASEPAKLAQLACDLKLPYDQMIVYPSFVHFSHKANGQQRGQVLYNKSYKGEKIKL